MYSQAYVRAKWKRKKRPSSTVAARDHGHWKGVAGRVEAAAKVLRRVEKWSPWVRLDVGRVVRELEDHKRSSQHYQIVTDKQPTQYRLALT